MATGIKAAELNGVMSLGCVIMASPVCCNYSAFRTVRCDAAHPPANQTLLIDATL